MSKPPSTARTPAGHGWPKQGLKETRMTTSEDVCEAVEQLGEAKERYQLAAGLRDNEFDALWQAKDLVHLRQVDFFLTCQAHPGLREVWG